MLLFRKMKPQGIRSINWTEEPLTQFVPDGEGFFAKIIAENHTLFLLFEEGRPIGMIVMEKDAVGQKPKCAAIRNLVILPEYRRRGLARMLMVIAAGEAVERQLWFMAGSVPETEDAQAFAKSVHMQPSEWFSDKYVLDLSDVEGMRHG
ncbi:MAG: GNAT family N-acetyltransferase [Oscillospiraceae bacterium]|nr:GNAT family N-acetyltransferase [Oscillospiraceae bacterium]